MFSLWKPANVTNRPSAPRSCGSSQACREKPDTGDHTAVSPISRAGLENQNECWLVPGRVERFIHTVGKDRHRDTWTLVQRQTLCPPLKAGGGLLFSNLQETLDYAQVRDLIQAVTLAA